MERQVRDAEDMAAFVQEFVAALAVLPSGATVIALSGELGAGKTTFAQAAAAALGVEETVNSPTFVIQKVYELPDSPPAGGWQHLVHVDAYRLKSADELRKLGWDDLMADPGNLIIIEWPSNVSDAITQEAHRVSIAIGEGSERTIHYDR